jgi:hypothetical protein
VHSRHGSEWSSFFLASNSGKVFYADDMGRCSEAGSTNSRITSMKLFDKREMIAIITEDLILAQYNLTAEGKMNLENEVKLFPFEAKYILITITTQVKNKFYWFQ